MTANLTADLQNWIPYKLWFNEGEALCKWLYTGTDSYSEPFFEESILKNKRLEKNNKPYKAVSNTDVIIEWAEHIDSVPPSAFIFHVSRCGSTLATQLLCLDPSNIALSEVPFFDELLRCRQQYASTANNDQLFKAAVQFYGAKKNPTAQRLFIKTDSWHIFFHQQIRKMYPTVPFILLYRRPDEVIRSQQKQRGLHAVPGLIEPELFGLSRKDIETPGLDGYLVKVLESYFTEFIEVLDKDPQAFLVNYKEGPAEMVRKIAAITNTNISTEHAKEMKQRSGFHSKHPKFVFSEAVLEEEAPSNLKKLFELYEALEKIRLATQQAPSL